MTDTRSAVDEVILVFGLGVADLRAQLAASVAEAEAISTNRRDVQFRLDRLQEQYDQQIKYKIPSLEEDVRRLRKAESAATEVGQQIAAERDAAVKAAADQLAQYDRLTLALSFLVAELEGHRDTAKVKSVGIALGHVVEKLLAIYSPPRGQDGKTA